MKIILHERAIVSAVVLMTRCETSIIYVLKIIQRGGKKKKINPLYFLLLPTLH
jgi:hypothetical protein